MEAMKNSSGTKKRPQVRLVWQYFPIQLFKDKWSLFVVAALPWVGKNSNITPMLCYIDLVGKNSYDAKILHMSNKIRQILNVIWRNKFRSKVDKIENPYNHRSLPLSCVKGMILSICGYFWNNFCQIPTLLCVTLRSIHLWKFSEKPKISTSPIHLW
jgi:hypothetical protein